MDKVKIFSKNYFPVFLNFLHVDTRVLTPLHHTKNEFLVFSIILNPIPNINPSNAIPTATPILQKSTIIGPISVGVTVTSLLHAISFPMVILGPNALPGIALAISFPCINPKSPDIALIKFSTCNVKSALDCSVDIGLAPFVIVPSLITL